MNKVWFLQEEVFNYAEDENEPERVTNIAEWETKPTNAEVIEEIKRQFIIMRDDELDELLAGEVSVCDEGRYYTIVESVIGFTE